MDQQAQMGNRTRRGRLPSVNEECKKMLENSVKTVGYELFDRPLHLEHHVVPRIAAQEFCVNLDIPTKIYVSGLRSKQVLSRPTWVLTSYKRVHLSRIQTTDSVIGGTIPIMIISSNCPNIDFISSGLSRISYDHSLRPDLRHPGIRTGFDKLTVVFDRAAAGRPDNARL
jgi:hypothetical protein